MHRITNMHKMVLLQMVPHSVEEKKQQTFEVARCMYQMFVPK